MSQYKAGDVTVTNNSPTVTGINTLWLANVTASDSFTVAGDGVMYDVGSVDSDTQITLSAPYAGTTASGAVYAIGTGFTVPDSFPEMSQGDIETATIFTRGMRKIQGKISALVSDISGKAAIAGQTFTGDIAAPKITASTGILFGTDTAAANTLDDYEEGTWTPVIGGGSCTNIVGKYTKVGNQVTVTMSILNGVLTDATTNTITGLPFTNGNTRSTTSAVAFIDICPNDNPIGLVNQDSATVRFVYNVGNGSWLLSDFTNTSGAYLHFSTTYFIN